MVWVYSALGLLSRLLLLLTLPLLFVGPTGLPEKALWLVELCDEGARRAWGGR